MGLLTMADVRRMKNRLAPAPQAKLDRVVEVAAKPAPAPVPVTPTTPNICLLHTILPSNSWANRRCFIVGGGPSVKDFDLSLLRGELVIGINRAYEICDPSILLAMDERYWGWITTGKLGEEAKQKYDTFNGLKCWAWFDTNSHLVPTDECYFLKCNPNHHFNRDLANGLYWGSNTGHGAVHLAYALGANPIYLIGYDMAPTQDQTKQWWHEGYHGDGQTSGVYALFRGEWKSEAVDVKGLGVDIVNLNPNSALTTFKRSTVEKENIIKVKHPLVINFYTDKYKQIAKQMEQSIRKFGFETELTHIQPTGNWLATVQYKAQFMLDKLLEHKRDVLWLDADSVVNSYPELFCNFKGDVGVHYIDWGRHTNGRRQQMELDSAVMYLAYNQRTIALLKAWVKAVAATPHRVEQLTLQDILETYNTSKYKVRVVNIPAEYCTIFDLMADVPNPVIEQFQASRQFRN